MLQWMTKISERQRNLTSSATLERAASAGWTWNARKQWNQKENKTLNSLISLTFSISRISESFIAKLRTSTFAQDEVQGSAESSRRRRQCDFMDFPYQPAGERARLWRIRKILHEDTFWPLYSEYVHFSLSTPSEGYDKLLNLIYIICDLHYTDIVSILFNHCHAF